MRNSLIKYLKNRFSFVTFLTLMILLTALFLKTNIFVSPYKIPNSTYSTQKILGTETRASLSPTPTLETSPVPTTTHHTIQVGIVVEDYANTTGQLSTLQKELGVSFSTISLYKQFGLPTNNMLNLSDLSYVKSQEKQLLVAWEPWDPREGLHQSKDYLKDIASGNEDAYIKSFADIVKAYGAPVTIRFGHEMNGDWYPWGQRPKDYVAAYRRIVELFRNEGVGNVSWMWAVNASPLSRVGEYYPGDAYVDSIGIDGFNFGTTQPTSTWVSFEDIFSDSYNLVAETYNKPIFISEVASTEQGGNKAAWVQNMFTSLRQSMPKVEGIIWFDIVKETDWRIDSSASSLNSFKEQL